MKKMFFLCGYTQKKLKFTGSFIYIPMESLRSNWSSRIHPDIFVRADLHGTIFVACDKLKLGYDCRVRRGKCHSKLKTFCKGGGS